MFCMNKIYVFAITLVITTAASAQTKRPLNPSDFMRYVDVSDPQVSPDGKWCTYTITTVDTSKDETNKDIWMVSWDGKETLQLTNSVDDENTARFSPDNK